MEGGLHVGVQWPVGTVTLKGEGVYSIQQTIHSVRVNSIFLYVLQYETAVKKLHLIQFFSNLVLYDVLMQKDTLRQNKQ
jgi:hypothetical protein